MVTYVRFTPQEFRAISRVCASLNFSDDAFPAFKAFLTDSLGPGFPALASRISRLDDCQIGLIYEHLKGQRAPAAQPGRDRRAAAGGQGPHLAGEDRKALARAAAFLRLHDECLPSFKACLVRLVGESSPALASRLARLTDHEVEALCRQVEGRRG